MIRIVKSLNVSEVVSKMQALVEIYGNTAALKFEADAKTNAPWADQTGNARNSIQGAFGWRGKTAAIELSGNTDYFQYLELANERRYSILKPTIEKNSNEVLSGFKELFR